MHRSGSNTLCNNRLDGNDFLIIGAQLRTDVFLSCVVDSPTADTVLIKMVLNFNIVENVTNV